MLIFVVLLLLLLVMVVSSSTMLLPPLDDENDLLLSIFLDFLGLVMVPLLSLWLREKRSLLKVLLLVVGVLLVLIGGGDGLLLRGRWVNAAAVARR